jgi:site-specific recombinase XerD
MNSCIGLLDRFLHGIKDMREVSAVDFRRFLADLRDRTVWRGLNNEQARHLSGTSINTYARAIKTFFNWLNVEGIIDNNPLAAVSIPRKPKTLPKVFSEKDMRAVCVAVAASVRDNAIFCLFLDSGLRLSELGGLRIGNVDTQGGTIKTLGKGNKERFVYFGNDAAKYIDCYIEQYRQGAAKGDFLFLNEDSRPLQARGIQSLLLRLGEKASLVERLSAHKLRHTFATLSLKYGGNLEYIRKILGHTDIKTTSEAYLNVQDADIKAAHQHFSPLSNLQGTAAGKVFVLPDGSKPGDQPAVSSTPTEQKPYVETPHKQQMRQLAEELIKELRLPWIKDSFVVELKPGQLFLGKERFPISITEKGNIRLGLSIVGERDIGLFHNALLTHLKTAGLATVMSDILTWSEGVANSLKTCHELLERVRGEVEDVYHTSIPVKDDGNPGLTMDFPILICADAVEQTAGFTHFNDFPYRIEGLNLKFGGFAIYNGVQNEDLKSFEDTHRRLRAECPKWKQTKAVAKCRLGLDDMATAIIQQLQKFIAMERLPGQCELCS